MRPNKELKLTKPAFGASQLNSVFCGLVGVRGRSELLRSRAAVALAGLLFVSTLGGIVQAGGDQ
jgi:hypothetical protein